MKDLKEVKELFAGLMVLVEDYKAAMADGKISIADLPVLAKLSSQVGVIVAAVEGLDQVPAELKDLTADEAKEVVGLVFGLVAAVKAKA